MSPLFDIAEAGRTRRWHTNPHLSHTDDYNDGHAARVTLMALTLCPGLSRHAIIYALGHDLGERYVADVAYDAKLRLAAEMLDHLENAESEARRHLLPGVDEYPLSKEEAKLIRMCDWLDAYLWMLKHRPVLAVRSDWVAQRGSTLSLARELGLSHQVSDFLEHAEQEYA